MDRHVADVVSELVVLVGSETKLAKRLKISQASIHRYAKDGQVPKKPHWDRIIALYMEIKGWRYGSLDDEVSRYPIDVQQGARDVLYAYLRSHDRKR